MKNVALGGGEMEGILWLSLNTYRLNKIKWVSLEQDFSEPLICLCILSYQEEREDNTLFSIF